MLKRKDMGGKKARIPLVNSTYQVISVLLHCLTAEKPHKTKGGWDRDNTKRLLFLGLNRDESKQKRITSVTSY